MGFPRDAFCGVITSGEVTHRALSERATPFWAARRRCLHFTWGARGAISLDGLGLEVVQDHTEADCIIAHGTEALGGDVSGAAAEAVPLDRLRALLEACAARSTEIGVPIPMVVANPDVVTVHGAELRTMPGTLARWYAEAGGEVHLMGKPAAIIYEGALEMLDLPAREIIAIGDSLEHDIAGAAAAGVNSLFIAGGIHAKELGVGGPEAPGWGAGGAEEEARLAALCEGFDAHPRYCTPYFSL
jgi:HAD superfamily hydrolase (TIGR01459 family)